MSLSVLGIFSNYWIRPREIAEDFISVSFEELVKIWKSQDRKNLRFSKNAEISECNVFSPSLIKMGNTACICGFSLGLWEWGLTFTTMTLIGLVWNTYLPRDSFTNAVCPWPYGSSNGQHPCVYQLQRIFLQTKPGRAFSRTGNIQAGYDKERDLSLHRFGESTASQFLVGRNLSAPKELVGSREEETFPA